VNTEGGLEGRIAALEAGLRSIADRDEIDRLITRYARAFDEDIDAEIGAILTGDAVLEIEPWIGEPVVGRENVVASFKDYIGKFTNRKRFVTNRHIELTGADTATGWANWLVTMARDGQSYCGWGCYDWEFRRDGGVWAIARMVIAVDSMTTLEAGWADMDALVAAYPETKSGGSG
jgi:hypothetical protein